MPEPNDNIGFTYSGNSEILAAWYTLALKQGYGREILPSIRKFLVDVGRRKFLTPIYTAMIEAGMKEEAQSIFTETRPNYHSVSYNTINALLEKAN